MSFSPNDMRIKLPKRPSDPTWGLMPSDMDMLDMFILNEFMPFHEIWRLIKDDKRSESSYKNAARGFLKQTDSEAYLIKRKSQIDAYFNPNSIDPFDIGLDEIPENAEEILMKKAWKEIDTKGLDSKAAEWWFKELLKGKDEITEVAPPLRILAESCHSCRYKAACEENLYDGCKYCKYKVFANENGVKYSHKDQLDLPKDFYTLIKTNKE